MNKIKILAAAVALSFCTSTMVFAQGNTLDIDSFISNNISDTYKVKKADISIKQAENSHDQAVKNASSYSDQFNDDLDSYTKLTIRQQIAITPRQAEFSIYKYTKEKEIVENKVKLDAYTQYEAIMNTKDVLELQQQKFDHSEQLYNSAKLKLNLGVVTEADVKQAEAAYYDAKAQLNKAQRGYDIQIMKLNQIFDIDVYVKYDTLLKDKVAETPYIRSYDDYLNDALENRGEIVIGQENIKLKEFEYNIIKGIYPSKYETSNKIGQYNLDKAKDTLELDKLYIANNINELYNNLQVKCKALDSKKDTLKLTETNYSIALAKYNAGVMSRIDFDSQKIGLRAAQNDLKSLQRDIWIAQFQLNIACGMGSDTSKITY